MSSKRLNAKERAVLRDLGTEALDLRFDHARRFRNAVYALAQMDPQWMIWVEENLPSDGTFRMRELILVESRARAFVLKVHGWLGRKCVGELVFRENWPFTDRGSLSPG